MAVSKGLQSTLNQIREISIENNTLYGKSVNEIHPDSDISTLTNPLFHDDSLLDEFFKILVKRIVYTQIVNYKLFNNPLKFLEGDSMPLGSIGQEIFINPVKGRKFNVNDFAGLLSKYEADIKVQYPNVNSDIQYPLTYTRDKLKGYFTSWGDLEGFINGITQSLYNSCYIDRYNFTKGLVASAYNSNNVQIETINKPTTEQQAKDFITKARTMFLNMQEPSSKYNAWRKVGGYGRDILTWTDKEDIVFLIRNDLAAYLDVNVLANAFNIDKTSLLGRIKYVNDFTERDTNDDVVIDGSNILAIMCDKSWFRIKNQETTTDTFYNPNNRSMQIYLNDVNMYRYSLFANAVVFASTMPVIKATSIIIKPEDKNVKMEIADDRIITAIPTPFNTTDEITFEADDSEDYILTEKYRDNQLKVTGVGAGTANITVKCNSHQDTAQIQVSEQS